MAQCTFLLLLTLLVGAATACQSKPTESPRTTASLDQSTEAPIPPVPAGEGLVSMECLDGPSSTADPTSFYCVKPSHYPEEEISELVDKFEASTGIRKSSSAVIVSSNNPNDDTSSNTDTTTFSPLDGGHRGELDLCPYDEDFVTPRVAIDKNNVRKYIVNVERMVQQIRVEKCKVAPGAECSLGSHRLSFSDDIGVRTECRQGYSTHRLVAFNETGHELEWGDFPFPTCCKCHYLG